MSADTESIRQSQRSAALSASASSPFFRHSLVPTTGRQVSNLHRGSIVLPLLSLGLLIRLLVSIFYATETEDTANYHRVALILLHGGHLYIDTHGIYPYPPPWALVEVAASAVSAASHLPFVVCVTLLPILGDVGIAFTAYLLLAQRPNIALAALVVYLFNPLTILISAVHGQFDSLPVFFTLVAVYAFRHYRGYIVPALFLAAGIAIKSFPVLLVPLFLLKVPSLRAKVTFLAFALAPATALLIPYLKYGLTPVMRELLGYSGVPDQGWGMLLWHGEMMMTGNILPVTIMHYPLFFSKLMFLAVYAALLLVFWQRQGRGTPLSLEQEICLVFLSFYTIYGGISGQYFLWLFPFLLLVDVRTAVLYSIVSTLALFAFYDGNAPSIVSRMPFPILPRPTATVIWMMLTGLWWLAVTSWESGLLVQTMSNRHQQGR